MDSRGGAEVSAGPDASGHGDMVKRSISIVGECIKADDVDGVQRACADLIEVSRNRPLCELHVLLEAHRYIVSRRPSTALEVASLTVAVHLLLVRDGAAAICYQMQLEHDLLRSLVVRSVQPQVFQTRMPDVNMSLLEVGIAYGNAANVLALLKAKASACVNYRTPKQATPLHFAIKVLPCLDGAQSTKWQDSALKIIRLLCLNGANPNMLHPVTELTALESLLSTSAYEEVLEPAVAVLLKAGANPCSFYKHVDVSSPLHCCLRYFSLPRTNVAVQLLLAKADPDVARVGDCVTPLDLAVTNSYGRSVTSPLRIPCGVCGLPSTVWCSGKSPFCRLAATCSAHCFEALFASHAGSCPCTESTVKCPVRAKLLMSGSVFKRGSFHPSRVPLQFAIDPLVPAGKLPLKNSEEQTAKKTQAEQSPRQPQANRSLQSMRTSTADQIRQQLASRSFRRNPSANSQAGRAIKQLQLKLACENEQRATENARLAADAAAILERRPGDPEATQMIRDVERVAQEVERTNALMREFSDMVPVNAPNNARAVREQLKQRLEQRKRIQQSV